MTTTAETESRAHESSVEPSSGKSAADPPSKRAESPVPAGSDNLQSLDALKRLSELYPKEVGKILCSNSADEWSSEI